MTAKTDRELLKLAAKAAGFGAPDTGGFCWTESEYPRGSGKNGALWNYVGSMEKAELWNPLTDDGDALRLAVKLNLAITCSNHETHVEGPRGADEYAWEPHGSDAHAASRRAIVRAAAAMGETL